MKSNKRFLAIMVAATTIISTSCTKNDETTPEEMDEKTLEYANFDYSSFNFGNLNSNDLAISNADTHLISSAGELKEGYIGSEKIHYQINDQGDYVLGGDMLLPKGVVITDEAVPTAKGAIPYGVRGWTNGVIPIQFTPGVPSQNRNSIIQAAGVWANRLGVRFVYYNPSQHRNYIRVIANGADYSRLGMYGGAQDLSTNDPYVSVAIHELGHALGLAHEHQRSDRNNHIIAYVNNPNISIQGTQNLTSFDWASIMLYPSKSIGGGRYDMVRRSDNRPFTNAIEYGRRNGTSYGPSNSDIQALRQFY
ncbi:M12 family metallopeptidase [Aquimarina sp. AU58]|uniref:M12 family metallopeptidase n=1 Tax=Aquimarina sp. AU58 TaxID=1874112 RepID=UPI000D6E0A85|nr:M12 family metallopeptidase [Aquimarina sp. AU58]